MPPAFPFPQIQAPARPEQCCFDCSQNPACRRTTAACFCHDFVVAEELEPRAFGWCGCTDRELCHEHAPKEAK